MQAFRFGDFRLDLDAQELRRDGVTVHLERRPFDLLVLLALRHGQVVSREDLISSLWPDGVIIDFDAGLNTLVRKARHALGDSPDTPRYIVTVPGRGYRCIMPLEPLEPAPASPAPPAPEPHSRRTRRWLPLAALGLVILALLAMSSWWRTPPDDAPLRIAVLPFENLTGNVEYEFIASGLAEETSVSLGRVELPNVAVIGGISARAIDASATSTGEIGRRLGVDYLVESSLRVDNTRIRVTSRLIRTANDEQVWTANFDRELTNLLGLQRELSVAIAEQVRQRLSPEVAAAIDRRQTQNPAAYALYLKGRYEWSQLSPASIRRAFEYYEQAVAEDPGYGLVWAGMANALSSSPMTIDARPSEVGPRARAALEKAHQFAPDLAETWNADAAYNLFIAWDFPAVDTASRRAIELDPNYAQAYMTLGATLPLLDGMLEAQDLMRRARELDPLFPLMFANSSNVANMAGDCEAGVEYAKQSIAIAPRFWVGYLHLGTAELCRGRLEAALLAYEEAERLSGGNSKPLSYRGFVLARLGREAEARQILSTLLQSSEERYLGATAIATVYCGLGETEQSFAWLERAVNQRDVHVLGIKERIFFGSLQDDPRFDDLVARIYGPHHGAEATP